MSRALIGKQNGASAALRRRGRWRADDARKVLERLEASGLSVRAFAAQESLNEERLYRWRKQLGRSGRPQFVEVVTPIATAPIEVVLRSGHVVRVPAAFAAETLRRVVDVLEG